MLETVLHIEIATVVTVPPIAAVDHLVDEVGTVIRQFQTWTDLPLISMSPTFMVCLEGTHLEWSIDSGRKKF